LKAEQQNEFLTLEWHPKKHKILLQMRKSSR
jgi:hypothetical protein